MTKEFTISGEPVVRSIAIGTCARAFEGELVFGWPEEPRGVVFDTNTGDISVHGRKITNDQELVLAFWSWVRGQCLGASK